MSSLILKNDAGDHVVILTLSRADKFNALSPDMVTALADELSALDAADDVRCVVLTGTGKAFAAGADIADMLDRGAESYLDPKRLAAWNAIENFPKPIVAAINGYALGGGCELLMLCDVLVASETAKFGQPEIKIGVLPGDGGTQRLPRIVGQSNAMKMILTGEMITADEACRIGLVSDVVSPDELMKCALEIAHQIAARPPKSVRAAKKAVRLARQLPLHEGLDAERDAVTKIFETEDRKEGMRAFLEKRLPKFSGR